MKKSTYIFSQRCRKGFRAFVALLVAAVMCTTFLTACAITKEAQYREAFDLVEQGKYEEAYALFTELGDYKDAAREAARFHYAIETLVVRNIEAEGTSTDTVTATFREDNLISHCITTADAEPPHHCDFTYNENGMLTLISCSDEDGDYEYYKATYDENGHIVKESFSYSDGFTYSYTYSYDENGRPTGCAVLYGNEASSFDYFYNEDNNVVKVVFKDQSGKETGIQENLYNEKGQKSKITYTENGTVIDVTEYTYNENGQLIRVHYEDDEGFSYVYEYTYDSNGNIIKDHTKYSDNTEMIFEAEYRLVYVPFDYSEEEWEYYIGNVFGW